MSEAKPDKQEVQHDAAQHVFFLTVADDTVTLKYRRPDDHSIDFYSTFTPNRLRGQGLARIVVDAGLAFARQHQLKITPSCSYVAKVLQQESADH